MRYEHIPFKNLWQLQFRQHYIIKDFYLEREENGATSVVCVFLDCKVYLPEHISKHVDSEAKLAKFSINKLILRLFNVAVDHSTNEKQCVIGFRVHRGYIFIDSEMEETFCLDDDCET